MNYDFGTSLYEETLSIKIPPVPKDNRTSSSSSKSRDSSKSLNGTRTTGYPKNQPPKRRNPTNCGPSRPRAVYGASVYSASQRNVSEFTQKVMSAKLLRVKQLQNELSETQNRLEELITENRTLKTLERRHASALQRLEGGQDQLPQLIRSHSEELRVLNAKLKQMREKYNEVEGKLKRRDLEYLTLKEHHKHLVKLSQDKNLFDREKLAKKVDQLEAKNKEQEEKIQMLSKKLEIESRSYRHQLSHESSKLRETQNDLKSALGTINNLKAALESKDKFAGGGSAAKKYQRTMESLMQHSHVSLPIPPRVSIRQPLRLEAGAHREPPTNESDTSDSEGSADELYGKEELCEKDSKSGSSEEEQQVSRLVTRIGPGARDIDVEGISARLSRGSSTGKLFLPSSTDDAVERLSKLSWEDMKREVSEKGEVLNLLNHTCSEPSQDQEELEKVLSSESLFSSGGENVLPVSPEGKNSVRHRSANKEIVKASVPDPIVTNLLSAEDASESILPETTLDPKKKANLLKILSDIDHAELEQDHAI